MNDSGIINKLKKKLEEIYRDLRSRIDPELWKKAVAEAYSEAPEETAVQVVDFMLAHGYVPVKVWRAVCRAAEVRNHPVMIADVYSRETVHQILEKMSGTDPLRYEYIPSECSNEQIEYIIDTAVNLHVYLKRGQIYMAGKALAELSKYCPTHPDVLGMQNIYAQIKCSGGVDIGREAMPFVPEESRQNGLRELALSADPDETAVQLEKMIGENYKCYQAYYPLGSIYLEKGDSVNADYIADVLLDLGHEKADACLLKGRILESCGQKEDAFFYYEEAGRYGGCSEAASERKRLLEEFAPGYEEYVSVKDNAPDPAEIKKGILDCEAPAAIECVKETDALVKRGRLTEAFYALTKKSQELPGSELLRFRKAVTLCLMRKEPEAREVLASVSADSPIRQHAVWIMEDINHRIVEGGDYAGVKPADLADILFEAGKYGEALKAYNEISGSDMTARMLARRGRCEVEKGLIVEALGSLVAAMDKDYYTPDVREPAALIYQAAGKDEYALAMYDDALKISSGAEYVRMCGLKAEFLYSRERSGELLKFMDQLESSAAPASDADGYTGLIYAHGKGVSRDPEKGLWYLERAISSGTGVHAFFTAAADVCIGLEQYFRAMMYIEKGLALPAADDKETDVLYMKKCELLCLSGKLDAAYTTAGMLLTKYPEAAGIQYIMGCVYSDRGDDREALKWFRNAADTDRNDHRYVYAAADKCFAAGDMTSALTYYSRSIMLDSSDYVSLKRRAYIYASSGADEKAVRDIKNALLLKPDDPECYILFGDILYDYELEDDLDLEGSTGGAVREPTPGDAEKPEGTETGNSVENADDIEDEDKDSEYYYGRAIEIDPGCRQAYISRAKYYTDRGRLDEALDDIQKAVELDDGEGDAYMMRGIVRHLRDENVQAVNDFERAAQTKRFALQAYSYMAKCNNALHDYEAAVEAAGKGIAIDREFLNLYVNRGVALYHLCKYHQAEDDFSRVLQKRNAVNTAAVEAAYRFRGMTNEKLGNDRQALNDYRMFIKYDPDHADIKNRIAVLESRIGTDKKKARFSFFKRKP